MAAASRKGPVSRRYEVVVSFSGLDVGEHFTASDDEHTAWASRHVESGYLREVPTGDPTVEEAPDAGEVGQG